MIRKSIMYAVLSSFYLLLLGSLLAWGGEPKVVALDLKFDLGKIPINTKVSHEFWIKNGGTDTLRIIGVSVP